MITAPFLGVRLCYGACLTELLPWRARNGVHPVRDATLFAAMLGGHIVIARTMLRINPNKTLNTTDGRWVLFLHDAVISNDVGFLAELNALCSVDDIIVNACNASLSTPLHASERYDCDGPSSGCSI